MDFVRICLLGISFILLQKEYLRCTKSIISSWLMYHIPQLNTYVNKLITVSVRRLLCICSWHAAMKFKIRIFKCAEISFQRQSTVVTKSVIKKYVCIYTSILTYKSLARMICTQYIKAVMETNYRNTHETNYFPAKSAKI